MVNLTKLFLRWCAQVRDFGIQHLCNMRNLQVLSVADPKSTALTTTPLRLVLLGLLAKINVDLFLSV
ncbi:hypothetical protein M8J77_016448 [Diaphorina citri]|nr:hypothetical protein M8J77_016448 [Diaphorina citri]